MLKVPENMGTDNNWVALVEAYRIEANQHLKKKTQVELGQFMTPGLVASFMASLFEIHDPKVTLLDPGAGVGSLTAAFIAAQIPNNAVLREITIDAYELDSLLTGYLDRTLSHCDAVCTEANVKFHGQSIHQDFITRTSELLWNANSLFQEPIRKYTHCILNPPYRKLRSDSHYRQQLSQIDIEATNLYSAFVSLAIKLLASQGQLVAIVPRSFCNGVYFKPFRQLLLSNMSIKQIHVFTSRTETFKENDVLQENVILYAVKDTEQTSVKITASSDASLSDMTVREVKFRELVKPNDLDYFIHIAASDFDQMVIDRLSAFSNTLDEIGIEVSTGPVVDFRLKEDLRENPDVGTVPLIYPSHFCDNQVQWPMSNSKKPNAIYESTNSRRWLMPNGWYVLTRRLSSTEERRRIVAAIYDPRRVPYEKIGFENHVNVFHINKAPLSDEVAKGLAIFLNSTLVDLYFRQFSGHTQVNATDLRMLHYPSVECLARLGKQINGVFPAQDEIDELIDQEIEQLESAYKQSRDPMTIQQKIQEAFSVLDELGMPRGQRNERSALTLLALLGLTPDLAWQQASAPLMGITPIMDFIKLHYARTYAPNTRETFRRQTMHQFVDAGIVLPNPDEPDRAINSPKWVYQIESHALELLRSFGSSNWKSNLEIYLATRRTLAEEYARKREMLKIPLVFGEKQELYLTPGTHSQLIQAIIEEFGPRFVPGAEVLYIGDTGAKMGYFDASVFQELELEFDSHGKFPDVVLYFRKENWLLLIEAVTSHGPVNAKRHAELANLFNKATAGLVYVTAFPDRQTMGKYLSEISWETEVWVAETPTHLIHFDGEQFLGPYE
ncbi:MAG: Eco57I restriction-modification methylase domain-containing protein [Caldilineaceae bacterium]|nr:Eco57I restriction-modification methylase domain-containing protein [Caldilineaceae bacterium]